MIWIFFSSTDLKWDLKLTTSAKTFQLKKNLCLFRAAVSFTSVGPISVPWLQAYRAKAIIAHDNSMMALTIGTSAPLHRSFLQQSISHLMIFPEETIFLQFFALQSDEVAHPLLKASCVTPEISAFTYTLAQRSWLSKQVTSFVLFLQSSQLLTETHAKHFRA